jgi:GNAT superfamily N-acetyltransferase
MWTGNPRAPVIMMGPTTYIANGAAAAPEGYQGPYYRRVSACGVPYWDANMNRFRETEAQKIEQPPLQRSTEDDAEEIANLYLASRADALPYLCRVHTDQEICAWIHHVMLKQGETWVARRNGLIVGFMTLIGDDLDQLYVLPGFYRSGVGLRLLNKAKERSPGRLRLFTFQRNKRARAFYEANGFKSIGVNDGSRNEEGEPDIHFEWTSVQSNRE